MAEFTKGEWKAKPIGGGITPLVYEIRDNSGKFIGRAKILANAQLIAVAVNACIKVNPDNPQTVAEALPAMYEALKALMSERYDEWSPKYKQATLALAQAESKVK